MQYRLEMFATEEDLENASLYEPSSFVGVVFTDPSAMSYRLRFPYDQLPQPSDYTESFGRSRRRYRSVQLRSRPLSH